MIENNETDVTGKQGSAVLALLEKVTGVVQTPQHDALWAEWLQVGGDEGPAQAKELLEMVQDTGQAINTAFRLRALAVIMAYVRDILPEGWCGAQASGLNELRPEEIRFPHGLHKDLLPVSAQVLLHSMLACREYAEANIHAVGKWPTGFAAWYNQVVRQYLTEIPGPDDHISIRLAEAYQLRDVSVLIEKDASGYSHFARFIHNRSISDNLKRLVDGRMRAIVTAEMNGETDFHAPSEWAIHAYMDIVSAASYMPSSYANPELVRSQVEFILEIIEVVPDKSVYAFKGRYLAGLVKVIGDAPGDTRKVRHNLIRNVLLGRPHKEGLYELGFAIGSECESEQVRDWMAEFANDDELVDELWALLVKWDQRPAEFDSELVRKNELAKAKQELLRLMA